MHDLVNMQSAGGFPLVYLQAAGSFPYGMLPLHDAFFTVAALVWGACWGSFLNVVIYRLPRGGSLIRPGSTCPSCLTPIRYYDNVPVLSYLLLGGKCRHCRASISARYPIVELVMAGLTVALYALLGVSWHLLFAFIFTAILVAISFIDMEHMIIPDWLSLPAIPLGFLCALVVPNLKVLDSLYGLLLGGGGLLVFSLLYRLIRGYHGLGGGDWKLMALIGAFLGWKAIPFVLFAGSAQGLIAALIMMALGKKSDSEQFHQVEDGEEDREYGEEEAESDLPPPGKFIIPFGPFLALGALEFLFIGENLLYSIFGLRKLWL